MTKIYLNATVCEYFGIPYASPDGQTAIIHASAMFAMHEHFDNEHLSFFKLKRSSTFTLKNLGFGWWEIVNAS